MRFLLRAKTEILEKPLHQQKLIIWHEKCHKISDVLYLLGLYTESITYNFIDKCVCSDIDGQFDACWDRGSFVAINIDDRPR